MKWGGAFCKKVEDGGVWGCKKMDLSTMQGALCAVSVFLFYIILIWGVRTHPTHPTAHGLVQTDNIIATPGIFDDKKISNLGKKSKQHQRARIRNGAKNFCSFR